MNEDEPMTPASVMKIQIALAVERAIASGTLDGAQQRVLLPEHRTAGPVGISLLRDEVSMSVRDLVAQMLTISDNVATDELIAIVGLDRINELTAELGLTRTRITSDLTSMLADMAVEAGFHDYSALARHDPDVTGPPSVDEVRERLHRSAALDPAKSGGLMGMVRNEAGVVGFPDGQQYVVAVFTRCAPGVTTDPAHIDAGIGRIARTLIDYLRRGTGETDNGADAAPRPHRHPHGRSPRQ